MACTPLSLLASSMRKTSTNRADAALSILLDQSLIVFFLVRMGVRFVYLAMIREQISASIAQSVEHSLSKRKVRSSILL